MVVAAAEQAGRGGKADGQPTFATMSKLPSVREAIGRPLAPQLILQMVAMGLFLSTCWQNINGMNAGRTFFCWTPLTKLRRR